jgi:hypothetical protein
MKGNVMLDLLLVLSRSTEYRWLLGLAKAEMMVRQWLLHDEFILCDLTLFYLRSTLKGSVIFAYVLQMKKTGLKKDNSKPEITASGS